VFGKPIQYFCELETLNEHVEIVHKMYFAEVRALWDKEVPRRSRVWRWTMVLKGIAVVLLSSSVLLNIYIIFINRYLMHGS
jgi:hypothetical protein